MWSCRHSWSETARGRWYPHWAWQRYDMWQQQIQNQLLHSSGPSESCQLCNHDRGLTRTSIVPRPTTTSIFSQRPLYHQWLRSTHIDIAQGNTGQITTMCWFRYDNNLMMMKHAYLSLEHSHPGSNNHRSVAEVWNGYVVISHKTFWVFLDDSKFLMMFTAICRL